MIEPARVAGDVPSPLLELTRRGSYSDCVGGGSGTTLYLLPCPAELTVVVPS